MIENEFKRLGALGVVGTALAAYAEAISLTGKFVLSDSGSRWVLRPHNYVTFEPHWKRTKNIRISLRGAPSEFAEFSELQLKEGMAGYSECTLNKSDQLAAAASYIRRAHELYRRGRSRTRKKQQVTES